MSRRGHYLLFALLVGIDAVMIALGWLAAPFIVGWLGRRFDFASHLVAVQYSLLPYLIIFAAVRLYDLDTVLEDSQEYATIATGCTYGVVGLIVVNAVTGGTDLSLTWVLTGWVLTMFTVAVGRFLARRVVRAFRQRGHLIARAVIVGADEQGRAIATQFRSVANSGVNVVGFVDDFLPVGTPVQDGLAVLGHPGALSQIVADYQVGEIVVVPGSLAWETFQEILERSTFSDGLRIRLSPGYYDLLATTPRVAHRNFVPLIVLDQARLSGFDLMTKNILDYGLGTLWLIASLPLMAALAFWLKMLNKGPVFEEHHFIGQGGRRFDLMTFRLEPDAPLYWLIRDTGMKYMPMLFAVLGGHMSLVGPRPVREDDRRNYQRWLPTIASVKPGITGPWAVVAVSSREEEMRAAIFYIRNWTIWLDLQILVQTGLVILRRRWERLTH
jgi:lipopolysaccharide/colanic/teichoic acid biosynthesis glycosyltransferase